MIFFTEDNYSSKYAYMSCYYVRALTQFQHFDKVYKNAAQKDNPDFFVSILYLVLSAKKINFEKSITSAELEILKLLYSCEIDIDNCNDIFFNWLFLKSCQHSVGSTYWSQLATGIWSIKLDMYYRLAERKNSNCCKQNIQIYCPNYILLSA